VKSPDHRHFQRRRRLWTAGNASPGKNPWPTRTGEHEEDEHTQEGRVSFGGAAMVASVVGLTAGLGGPSQTPGATL
jgi:hypothetical protein